MDPFYAKCRAFGQIQEQGLNGRMAVECYGFMSVPANHEERLGRKFGIFDCDRPDAEYFQNSSTRQRFRRIVKEVVRCDTGITSKDIMKMAWSLKRLRSMGVYPMDVRAPNYRAGRLLDFSIACTELHIMFQIRPRLMVQELKCQDLIMFDEMIIDENIKTEVKMMRNYEYCRKLRHSTKKLRSLP